eukprot:Tbor_TRINITY_DN5753_c0_g2::TRINITY_DN5753_c0_g2_i3::g.20750::m.20750
MSNPKRIVGVRIHILSRKFTLIQKKMTLSELHTFRCENHMFFLSAILKDELPHKEGLTRVCRRLHTLYGTRTKVNTVTLSVFLAIMNKPEIYVERQEEPYLLSLVLMKIPQK